MVFEARKQSMAWMETDYSKHRNFRLKIKWRLEHLGALGIMGDDYGFWYCVKNLHKLSPSSSPEVRICLRSCIKLLCWITFPNTSTSQFPNLDWMWSNIQQDQGWRMAWKSWGTYLQVPLNGLLHILKGGILSQTSWEVLHVVQQAVQRLANLVWKHDIVNNLTGFATWVWLPKNLLAVTYL